MKKVEIRAQLFVYENPEELPSGERQLVLEACRIREKAYAPYSKFKVGAAVLLENGETVVGNNQENASYPCGLCAERVAVYQAGAIYPGVGIKALAISAASDLHKVDTPIPPCGACRQSISEFEMAQKHPIAVFFMGESGEVIKAQSVKDLLPFGFSKEDLNII